MDHDVFGPLGPAVPDILFAVGGLVYLVFVVIVAAVLVALAVVFVRFLLVGTRAAQIYVEKNSPPKSEIVNQIGDPRTQAAPQSSPAPAPAPAPVPSPAAPEPVAPEPSAAVAEPEPIAPELSGLSNEPTVTTPAEAAQPEVVATPVSKPVAKKAPAKKAPAPKPAATEPVVDPSAPVKPAVTRAPRKPKTPPAV